VVVTPWDSSGTGPQALFDAPSEELDDDELDDDPADEELEPLSDVEEDDVPSPLALDEFAVDFDELA
jgi:hypothetical protein